MTHLLNQRERSLPQLQITDVRVLVRCNIVHKGIMNKLQIKIRPHPTSTAIHSISMTLMPEYELWMVALSEANQLVAGYGVPPIVMG